ncbi:MAG TPA: Holliday junction resolvase RuvX [Armatimonadota bacterium]|jgi:putative Holliday junction resolvase|nr:Holliday junction resolvase RuvX [Armatimonadota bacterium]HPP75171.1 Holliday junction resolvase RuvX [Armatimonadota bacterium]
MARVMALDVGEKTIGVALSDETGTIASPLTTIRRTESIKADLREVVRLIEEHDVSKVVVGIPKMLSGEEAVQAGKVREFADRLARRLRIPLDLWDERLTTVEAERILMDAGKDRIERKKVVDQMAAAIILRSYLEAKGA